MTSYREHITKWVISSTGEVHTTFPPWGRGQCGWQRIHSTGLLERDLETRKHDSFSVRPEKDEGTGSKDHLLHLSKCYSTYDRGLISADPIEDALALQRREGVNPLVQLWISNVGKRDRSYKSLSGFLKNLDVWILAYAKLSTNPGSMTAGPDKQTIDGTSIKKIIALKDAVLNGSFEWGGIKRVYIPKPGKAEKRPLGVPCFQDRIVQEVLRMLLEPIFESSFSQRSHGFRPERSAHTALRTIKRDMKATMWFIEGDISKFFDRVNHSILCSLIQKKVRDKKVLKLIRTGLNAKIHMPNGLEISSDMGTPQGGVLSPLLSNIYLNELDKWMEELMNAYFCGKGPRKNPIWSKLRRKGLMKKARQNPWNDPLDPNYRRMEYIRYADDFLIAIRGPREDAAKIKNELAAFLQTKLRLELNLEKTHITHISKGVAFLGHVLSRRQIYTYQRYGKEKQYKKRRMSILTVDADMKKQKAKLLAQKYIDGEGQPLPCFGLLRLPQSEANMRINSVLRGLSNWFEYAGNRRRVLSWVAYVLRYSLAKMYAAKYKLHTVAKVFKRGGNDLSNPLKAREGFSHVGVTDEQIMKWEGSVTGKGTPRKIPGILFEKYYKISHPNKTPLAKGWQPKHEKILNNIYDKQTGKILEKERQKLIDLINARARSSSTDPMERLAWRLSKGVSALYAACVLCGSDQNVEMHHVRALKDLKRKKRNALEVHMIAIARKQLPLCRRCHLRAHKGSWKITPERFPTSNTL
jgi:group II intron reverse transcriptase/maturase